jgi:NTP pyrophosphatase (non-canonical NTP hydrolase)
MLVSAEFLAVLIEEVGEVGKALQGDGDLKEELIQVASVVVRWLENMK